MEFDQDGNIVRQKKGCGYVYFVEGAGLVKIGVSVNPQKRVDDLRIGSPIPLSLLGYYPGGFEGEQELHRRFQDDLSHGEWYNPSYALDVVIARAHEYMEDHRVAAQQEKAA